MKTILDTVDSRERERLERRLSALRESSRPLLEAARDEEPLSGADLERWGDS